MGSKRVAMIGMGGIAQKVYAPLLAWNESVEVQGIMSRTQSTVDQIQAKYRFPRGTTELKELLSWDLDAVFVHSPTESHYEIVMQCLQQGVSVYVDKPLSAVWKESVEMTELAEKKGLILGVGFNRRFAPLYIEAKEWMEGSSSSGFSYASAQKHRTYKQQQSAKVTIYDDLIHMLDLLVWLAGVDVELQTNRVLADDKGLMEYITGMLSNGASSATYSMARNAGFDLEKLEMHGGGRSVEVINLDKIHLYERNVLERVHTFGSWETIWERRGFTGVVNHFLESLDHPESCRIRADQVLSTHALVERILESS